MSERTIAPQRDEGDETPQCLADIDPRLATLDYERAQGHFRTDGEEQESDNA